MQAKTRGGNNNPTGKGGFGDNPQNKNQNGQRNKNAVAFARSLREYIVSEGKRSLVLENGEKLTKIEMVIRAIYEEAIAGNMSAATFLAERVEGKVADKTELSGAITYEISYVNDWRIEANQIAETAFGAAGDSE